MPEASTPTIDRLVRSRAAEFGGKPMVIDPGYRITYDQLDTATRNSPRCSCRPASARAPGWD